MGGKDEAGRASAGSPQRPLLLLVDDDPLIVESLAYILEPDFEVLIADSRPATKALLRKRANGVPSIALVDLGLPPTPHAPEEGFALIGELLGFNRAMKILVLSGQNRRANIQHALTLGAVDFVPKPCDAELLRARLQHQLMILEAERAGAEALESDATLIGTSGAIQTLKALIKQFASTPFPVLIEGESGTGKELVTECLHRQGDRRDAPLLTINCAAFTADLLEAQLFGHARGAFTGASDAHAGFFEDAGSGTLSLDEVGEFPLSLQPKLLRVLEKGEYYRIGETQPRVSSARIIAATNRDLREEVRHGRFRSDLYHRLSVLTIAVPPLRERGADCLMLLDHFRRQYAASVPPFELERSAEEYLARYGFPGNVRELRNIVIRLGSKYPGETVSLESLKPELQVEAPATPAAGPLAVAAVEELGAPGFQLDERLRDWERRYISAALKQAGGNLSQAARLLGVNRTTLYSRIQRAGLEIE
jgi:DNA-binding NtrC family response regulator